MSGFVGVLGKICDPNSNLEVIDLSNSALTNEQACQLMELLQNFPLVAGKIKELHLQHNALTFLVLPKVMTGLQTIDVSHNQLLLLQAPKELANLQAILASGNKIISFDLSHALPKLVTLNIQDNKKQLPTLRLHASLQGVTQLLIDTDQHVAFAGEQAPPSTQKTYSSKELIDDVVLNEALPDNLQYQIVKLFREVARVPQPYENEQESLEQLKKELENLLSGWNIVFGEITQEDMVFVETLQKIAMSEGLNEQLRYVRFEIVNLTTFDQTLKNIWAMREKVLGMVIDADNLDRNLLRKNTSQLWDYWLKAICIMRSDKFAARKSELAARAVPAEIATSSSDIPYHNLQFMRNLSSSAYEKINSIVTDKWYDDHDILDGIFMQLLASDLCLERYSYNSVVLSHYGAPYIFGNEQKAIFAVAREQTIYIPQSDSAASSTNLWLNNQKNETTKAQLHGLKETINNILQKEAGNSARIVLFPLRLNDNHWCAAQLIFVPTFFKPIHKNGYSLVVNIYDSLDIADTRKAEIQEHFNATFKAYATGKIAFFVCKSGTQQDGSSCGPITVDVICQLITNGKADPKLYYPAEIKRLRELHTPREYAPHRGISHNRGLSDSKRMKIS